MSLQRQKFCLYFVSVVVSMLAFSAYAFGVGEVEYHEERSIVRRQNNIEEQQQQQVSTMDTGPGLVLNSSVPITTQMVVPIPLAACVSTANVTESRTYTRTTTVVQVAVAVICPASTPVVSDQLSPPSTIDNATTGVNLTIPLTVGNISQASGVESSVPEVYPTITQSLAGSNVTLTASADLANFARVVQDSNGCQTIYTDRTTVLCNTRLKLAGLPPVSVTDCEQMLTFSTADLAASECAASDSSLGLSSSGTTTVTSQNENDFTTASPLSSKVDYFAAMWHDLADNDIPSSVWIERCDATGTKDGNCSMRTESWELSSVMITTIGLTTAIFSGPVVISLGMSTFLTTVSINETLTTTNTILSPTILRNEVGGDASITADSWTPTDTEPPLTGPSSELAPATVTVYTASTQTYRLETVRSTTTTQDTITSTAVDYSSTTADVDDAMSSTDAAPAEGVAGDSMSNDESSAMQVDAAVTSSSSQLVNFSSNITFSLTQGLRLRARQFIA